MKKEYPVTNKHLFFSEQGCLRYSNIINDRLREEYYPANFKEPLYSDRVYSQHLVWDNINHDLRVEGIMILVEYKTP